MVSPAVQTPAVCDYVYVYEEGDLVVAVVLAPLMGRTARNAALQEVAQGLSRSDRTVYVTCDLDLYRKVQKAQVGNLRATILSRHNGAVCYGDYGDPSRRPDPTDKKALSA